MQYHGPEAGRATGPQARRPTTVQRGEPGRVAHVHRQRKLRPVCGESDAVYEQHCAIDECRAGISKAGHRFLSPCGSGNSSERGNGSQTSRRQKP